MKVAIYSGQIPSTTFIERLIQGVAERGTTVLLFGIKNKNIRYALNIKIIGYSNSKWSKALHFIKYSLLLSFLKPRQKGQLDRYLRKNKQFNLNERLKYYPVLFYQPQILHLQWAKSLKDWLWVQEFGIRVVLSLRGAHINYSPVADQHLAAIYRKNFPKVNGFHAVSKAIAREAQKYAADKDKIKIIYSGIVYNDIDILKKSDHTVFKIISVGRTHWVKGYTYALDACNILKKKGFQFRYDIIGVKPSVELLYQVKELKLEDTVFFGDSLANEEVMAMIRKSDLLLLPSVEEGLANVVIESMSVGTIVLSTNCGGMPEVINHGVNGFLMPIRDARSMSEQIITISNLTASRKMSILKEAQSTIIKRHSAEVMASKMIQLYHNALSQNC